MGRWSYDIMGGDNPLDHECEIYDICLLIMFPYDTEGQKTEMPGELLASRQNEILDRYISAKENEGILVLGYMMMQAGSIMLPNIKEAILKACDNDDVDDGNERKIVIKEFKSKVVNYEDSPIELHSAGLFETIGKHIEKGGKGLVNL